MQPKLYIIIGKISKVVINLWKIHNLALYLLFPFFYMMDHGMTQYLGHLLNITIAFTTISFISILLNYFFYICKTNNSVKLLQAISIFQIMIHVSWVVLSYYGFILSLNITQETSLTYYIQYLYTSNLVSLFFAHILHIFTIYLMTAIFYGFSKVYVSDVKQKKIKEQVFNHINDFTEINIFSNILNKFNNDDCSICINSFHKKDEIRVLPCSHFFHKECIDDWIQKENSCPICRQLISEFI